MKNQRVFRFCAALLAMLVCISGHRPASAAQRVALVIGNSAYQSVPFLPNPVNDAADMSSSFKRLGFDVRTILNAKYDEFRRALIEFSQRSVGAEFAVIYFAGHGIQVSGENWLIPIDAELATDRTVENEAVSLQSLTRAVSSATKLGLVILDACRSNPFVPKMRGAGLSRAIDRGFARVEPAENVLVAFAARDGTTASDGDGRNSPFTKSLLRHLETPGLEVRFLFANVRDDVMSATKREQQPFMYGSLSREQIFLSNSGETQSSGQPSDDFVWSFIKGSTDLAALRQYLSAFPTGKHRQEARDRLARLSPSGLDDVQKPKEQARPPSSASAPSSTGVMGVSRVVLYDEDPASPMGRQYTGSVAWRTEQIKPVGNQKADVAVRADIEIPDRKLKMTMSFRRNTDSSLPASHTIEITTLPQDFGIREIPGILMKSNEQARGAALAGLAVKVTDGFFLVGFSNDEADRVRNIALLKERAWFDVPFKYTDGQRGILAIEKGELGERAYAAAFAAWGQ